VLKPRLLVQLPIIVVLSLVLATPVRALSIGLNVVDFPSRRNIDLTFAFRPGAPAASMEAIVEYRDGQARVQIYFQKMKPAILFGGDVTCYVLWAVTRDGQSENLGELLVPTPDYRLEYSTKQKSFALLVTAEPYYLVTRPSELVIATTGPSNDERAPATSFSFSGFDAAPEHALDSIRPISWDSGTPLDLLQARKAHELAGRRDARQHAPQVFQEAGEALAEAERIAKDSPGSRRVLDAARRSVALSNVAINIATHRQESLAIEKQLIERRQEMATLELRAKEAETRARQTATLADELSAEMERVRGEKERLSGETAKLEEQRRSLQAAMDRLNEEKLSLEMATRGLQKEKSELGSRLQAALSHVAETKETIRGLVVNLPDILFDVGEATLKPETRIVLAKLAGILLIMPDLKVAIEGHTDATGSAAYNLKLSQRRARTVLEFLRDQEVSADRLTAVGYGMDRPVADNDTRQGRQKNRRVEIVLSDESTPPQ